MVRVIAIANRIEGVGKTTTAVNLSAGVAQHGRRVLLVDTDVEGYLGHSLGVSTNSGSAELMSGQASVEDVTIEARSNLHLIASGPGLANVKQDIK